MTPAEVGCFLIGCVVGALGSFGLAGLAWFFVDVRRAVVEGPPIEGEGIERMRKRGEL